MVVREAAGGRAFIYRVATILGDFRKKPPPPPRPVELVDALTPALARGRNLAFVCDALETAGISYFRVRNRNDAMSAVAVRAADRERVARALMAAGTGGGFQLKAVSAADKPLPVWEPESWEAVESAQVVRIFQVFATPCGRLSLGRAHGCDVEFWETSGKELIAPRSNLVAERIPADGEVTTAGESLFTSLLPHQDDGRRYPVRAEFVRRLSLDVTFPVDAVYTWVDGADPAWRRRRDEHLGRDPEPLSELAANESRYVNRDELRYSLRSLSMFAPWIRHVWIVTDQQVPPWLDLSSPLVTVVDHREIFADSDALPTFNSHAIESRLHHIPGLSEHFLYFNDDFFLGRVTTPGQFFHANGISKFFPSSAKVPGGGRTPDDEPVVAAGKNNRALVERVFERHVVDKMKHIPYALRRSVLQELEERFPEEVGRTTGHRFRHPDDVSIASSLYQYYSFLTGRAVPSKLAYKYVDLAEPEAKDEMAAILERRPLDAFCLNDTECDESLRDLQLDLVTRFLAGYFPVPSPFELPA